MKLLLGVSIGTPLHHWACLVETLHGHVGVEIPAVEKEKDRLNGLLPRSLAPGMDTEFLAMGRLITSVQLFLDVELTPVTAEISRNRASGEKDVE